MEIEVIKSKIIGLRENYIVKEREHYNKTKEKSKVLRAKVSAIDKVLNTLGLNDRG